MGKAANHHSITTIIMKHRYSSPNQSLSHLVVNAKLDRPLDSHPPQTEHMYYYDNDDWGEQHEHGEDQWEYQDKQWYDEQAEETYAIEEE